MAREHVGEMGEVALPGADPPADFDGFFQGIVGDVVAALDGVQHENIESLQFLEFRFGKLEEV